MNLLKMVQDVANAMSGFSEEQRKGIEALSSVPGAKLSVPTPGTDSKLNGKTPADIIASISGLAANFAPGYQPRKADLAEGAGLNPKSSRDMAALDKALPNVPEIEIQKGSPTRYVRRLTGPSRDEPNKDE